MRIIQLFILVQLISFFKPVNLTSQELACPEIEFKNFNFDWHHRPYDDSLIDTLCQWCDGSVHYYFNYSKHILTEDYLYIAYPTYIYYVELEGFRLEKIDLLNGDKVWSHNIDLRNNDKQEVLAAMKLVNGNIEIYTYRRINENGQGFGPFNITLSQIDPTVLCKRSFDKDNGILIETICPKDIGPSTKILYKPTRSKLGEIIPLNDSIYLSVYRNEKTISSNHVNIKTGTSVLNSEDSIKLAKPYDSNFAEIFPNEVFKIKSPDTIILVNSLSSSQSKTFDHQATIVIYDRYLNKIKSLNIEPFLGDFAYLLLHKADERYIYIQINRAFSSSDTFYPEYYIFDYEGNLVNHYIFELNGISLNRVEINPTEEFGRFLVTAQFQKDNTILLYTLERDMTLKLLQTIKMSGKYTMMSNWITKINSDDYLMRGTIGEFIDNVFKGVCHYNFFKFSKDQLSNLLENADSKHFVTYPNPSSGPLTIEMQGITGKADIKIFDMTGRNVYVQQNITLDKTTMDLSQLPSGMYVYKLYQNTKEISSGKWVKKF